MVSSELIVHQQRYRPSDSNKKVYIKCSAHDAQSKTIQNPNKFFACKKTKVNVWNFISCLIQCTWYEILQHVSLIGNLSNINWNRSYLFKISRWLFKAAKLIDNIPMLIGNLSNINWNRSYLFKISRWLFKAAMLIDNFPMLVNNIHMLSRSIGLALISVCVLPIPSWYFQ